MSDLLLSEPWFSVGTFHSLKATPNVFFLEKSDWAKQCFLRTSREKLHIASLYYQGRIANSQIPVNKWLEASWLLMTFNRVYGRQPKFIFV